MAEKSFKERVLEVLKSHEDDALTVSELSEATGLTKQQVHNVMSQLHRTMSPYVRKVDASVYVFSSSKAPSGGMFEKVGEVKGRPVVRDDAGNLYRIEPLESL